MRFLSFLPTFLSILEFDHKTPNGFKSDEYVYLLLTDYLFGFIIPYFKEKLES
jgi:hypothetical protein